jgi:hypothetical protein
LCSLNAFFAPVSDIVPKIPAILRVFSSHSFGTLHYLATTAKRFLQHFLLTLLPTDFSYFRVDDQGCQGEENK